MPVARAASRRSTAPPGGVVSPSEPTCSATAPSSADVSSSSVHCQSAVPSTRKSYAAEPSACSATIASDDDSGAATAYERSTPLPARCARNRRPSTSSESRTSIRAGTSEPGQADRDVRRAASRGGPEDTVLAGRHQVGDDLTGDRDDGLHAAEPTAPTIFGDA